MHKMDIYSVILAAQLLIIAWHDQRTYVIPNISNALLGISGLAVTIFGFGQSVAETLTACAVVFMAIAAVMHLYKRWRQKPGLGMGDAKFLAAAAAWVGLQGIPWVILIASLSGLAFVVAGGLVSRGSMNLTSRIPFGPHLSAGLLFTWLLRDVILPFPVGDG
jgi:leader peptidase (prepilin peptidase) / N-methyltransferase